MISRRSGSRVSIHNRVRLNRCLEHQASRVTLCPLGQPEKAIGRESQIEPWLAIRNRSACCVRKNRLSLEDHYESAEKRKPRRSITVWAGYHLGLQSTPKYFS